MALSVAAKKFIEDQWTEGDSAGVIQAKLSREMKICVTRNTVLGHIDRAKKAGRIEGREGRTGNVIAFRKPLNSLHPKPKARIAHQPRLPRPEIIGPLNDFPKAPDGLHRACQYTKDDPAAGDWRMCGQPTRDLSHPFCDYHHIVCHQQKQQEKVDDNGEAEAGAAQGGELSRRSA